jgi:hypothetical protein
MASVLEGWWSGQYPCYSLKNLSSIPVYHTLLSCNHAFTTDNKGYTEIYKVLNNCRIYEWFNSFLGYGEKIGHDLSSDTWFYEHWFPESICRTVINSWKCKDTEWGVVIRYYNSYELWQKWSVKNNERQFEEFQVQNSTKKGKILTQIFGQGGIEEYIEQYLETNNFHKKEKEWVMPGYHKLEIESLQDDIYNFTQTLTTEQAYEKKVIQKAKGKELSLYEGKRGNKTWKEISETDQDSKRVDNSYMELGKKWGNKLKCKGDLNIREEWEGEPHIEEPKLNFRALEKLLKLVISDKWENYTESWTNLAIENVTSSIQGILSKYDRELKFAASYMRKDVEETILGMSEEGLEYISKLKSISLELEDILYKDILSLYDILEYSFKLETLKQDFHLIRIQAKRIARSSLDSQTKTLSLSSSDQFDTMTTCSEDFKKPQDEYEIVRLTSGLSALVVLSMQNYTQLMNLVGDVCDSASIYSSFSCELDTHIPTDFDKAFEFEKKKAILLEKFEEMKKSLNRVVKELRDQRVKRDSVLKESQDSNTLEALIEELKLFNKQERLSESKESKDLSIISAACDKELEILKTEVLGISDTEFSQKISEFTYALEATRDTIETDSIPRKIQLISQANSLLTSYKQKIIDTLKYESSKKESQFSTKIFQLAKAVSSHEKLTKQHDTELADYKNFISSMNNLVKSSQFEVIQVRSECELVKQRNSTLQEEIARYQEIIHKSEEQISSILNELRVQEEEASTLQTFINQKLKDKIDPKELRVLDNSRSMRQEIVLLKHKNFEKDQQINSINKQLLEAIRNNQELKSSLTSASSEIEVNKIKLSHLENQLTEARESLVKMNAADSIGTDVIKQTFKRIKSKISNYKNMYYTLKEELEKLETQHTHMQIQNRDLRTQLQELYKEKESLSKATEDLKKARAEAQEWRLKHDELKRVLSAYEGASERNIESAITKLNSEITAKQRELEALQSSFDSSKEAELQERELRNLMSIRKSLSHIHIRIREMKRGAFQRWCLLSKLNRVDIV